MRFNAYGVLREQPDSSAVGAVVPVTGHTGELQKEGCFGPPSGALNLHAHLHPGVAMAVSRCCAIIFLTGTVLLFQAFPAAGQGNAKAKAKQGFPLVGDPNDLPKPGAALSPWAIVQRPASLKNVRAWSIESKKHRWVVDYVAVRPDGKKFATSGHDSAVRIWDVVTGAFERALLGHEGRVTGLAWSPDGKYLASAGYYSTRVWDGTTGLPVRVLRGKYGVSLVAWSPDGTRLLTGGGGSGQLAMWDVAAGKQLAEMEYGNPIGSIAFSPSGEHVAAAASRAGTYIADSVKLKTVHVFKEMLDTDHAVAFSPDGKQLAAGSAKQTAIYNVESGTMARKLATPGFALVWTPKGGLIISGKSYQVTPYSPAEFAPARPLPGTAAVLSLSADGSGLFGLLGGTVTHWNLDTSASVRTTTVGEYATLYCGPSTSVLVPGPTPALWDATTGKRIGGLDQHKGGIVAAAWGPTGKALAVAAADRKIRIHEPATAKELRTLTAHTAVVSLAVAADGKVAASTADKKVIIWPSTGDQHSHVLDGFDNPVRALAWTRDGRLIATAVDKEIAIYTADTGKKIKSLEHPRPVHSVLWSTDSSRLLVGSSEEVALAAYQASTWKLLPSLDKGTNALSVVANMWSPDGSVLLGYRSSAIQQWNGRSGARGTAIGSIGPAPTIAFWPDGRTVAAGCGDRAARYWDAASGRLRMMLIAERDQTFSVSAEGHHRCPEAIEDDVIAVVISDKAQETLALKEFTTKYGFRNVPGNVK
jgi:WD40 repeat protein